MVGLLNFFRDGTLPDKKSGHLNKMLKKINTHRSSIVTGQNFFSFCPLMMIIKCERLEYKEA